MAVGLAPAAASRSLPSIAVLRAGATAAAFVGVASICSCYAMGGLLLTFFVSSSLLTRFAGDTKKKIDETYKQDGQRDWRQVMCNGGIPSILAVIYAAYVGFAHVPFLHGCAVIMRC